MGGAYVVCVGVEPWSEGSARVGECACRGIRAGEMLACTGGATGVHAGESAEVSSVPDCVCGVKS